MTRAAVGRREVGGEAAVQVVAVPRPVAPRISASDSQPRLDTPASATSDSASSMNAPLPVRSRSCRAASIPVATLTPVIRSQAGRTWLTGFVAPSVPPGR